MRYRARFRRILRIEVLATVLFYGGIAGILLVLWNAVGSDLFAPTHLGPYLIAITVVVVVGGGVTMILNWRCPRCGRYLAQARSIHLLYLPEVSIRHCPHCHLELH